MRRFLLLPALLGGMLLPGHAFTLDFAEAQAADQDRGPQSIHISGYGELIFETGPGLVLVIDSGYASTSGVALSVPHAEQEETVNVTFKDANPMWVDMDFTTLLESPPEQNPDDESDDDHVRWFVVPEPASAILGLIGTLLLLRRRR